MNGLPARARRACQLLMVMLAPAVAPAAWADESPLSLQQAVEWSLQRNPELTAFGFQLKAQQAQGQQAALRPAPSLSVEIEDVLGSGSARGIDSAQATFALSQVIEFGGKRDARIAVQRSSLASLQTARQAQQLDVLAEVARRYIHVASDQEQLRLTERATALARDTIDATAQRVRAAKAPEVELRRARVALARAEIEQEHAEHELLSSRQQLAAMWGETEVRFGAVTADLYQLPAAADYAALAAALERNPDRLRFISEARLRDAEVRLAQSKSKTDLEFTAGIRRRQESRDQALVLGMSMPLFGSSRAQDLVAEAEALRQKTDAEQTAHDVRARTQLFALHQELNHALAEAEMLRERVLPELEAALKEVRYAFERGRYGYLEWVDAQRELLATQRALIESSANAHLFQAEIERLTGQPLAVSSLRDPS